MPKRSLSGLLLPLLLLSLCKLDRIFEAYVSACRGNSTVNSCKAHIQHGAGQGQLQRHSSPPLLHSLQ